MSQNYYDILGVDSSASQEDIKTAFRNKAKKYHPDRNQGDKSAEEMFKKINNAYSVLGNQEKRRMYDSGVDPNKYGSQRNGFNGFNGFDDFDGFSSFNRANPFADFFSNFDRNFKNAQHNHNMGPQVTNTNITISLYDSIFGANKEIKLNYNPICTACNGTGAKEFETCKHCNGRGVVVEQNGFTRTVTPCPICRGTGKIVKVVCDKCNGTGKSGLKTKIVNIKIEPGIRSGQRMVIKGAGIPDKNGNPGILVVNIDVSFPKYSSFSEEDKSILQKLLNK